MVCSINWEALDRMQTMNCDIDYILVGGGNETKQ